MKKLVIFLISIFSVILMISIFALILYLGIHYGRTIASVLIVIIIILLIINIYRSIENNW